MERRCIINFQMLRPVIIFVLRILLGGIFIIAAYGKLLHPQSLESIVVNYNILPLFMARYFAYALPWAELLAGIMLVLGIFTRGSALAVGLLLAAFIFAVSINIFRGVSMDCGCFDIFGMHEKIGSVIIIRDIIFFVVSVFLVYTREFIFSIDNYLKKYFK
ncbi:MAG: DoxX family membrane protein [Deltaproteobacteria bacterium]|nr:DoxX family membrane protein [Deltaproteobacteria bacterium]MCL5791402.1 DoxX family membrane protein [Deltaproteobacteria bacterium]